MATSYKIRLKRFNGTDYDTLNLLSDNIIMSTGNTLQDDIVPNSNGILKNNNGTFNIASLGTDYGDLSFTITLLVSSWSNNSQTINDNRFVNSGYAFEISPDPTYFTIYGESQIYADNVTTNGSITFHCGEVPSSNIVVNIKRSVSA